MKYIVYLTDINSPVTSSPSKQMSSSALMTKSVSEASFEPVGLVLVCLFITSSKTYKTFKLMN